MKPLLFLLFLIALPVLGYEVYQYNLLPQDKIHSSDEHLLFVIDFSQSMSETHHGESKANMVQDVLRQFLPEIPKQIPVGLRVYGHKLERENGEMFWGAGTDTDVIKASTNALLSAFCNMTKGGN